MSPQPGLSPLHIGIGYTQTGYATLQASDQRTARGGAGSSSSIVMLGKSPAMYISGARAEEGLAFAAPLHVLPDHVRPSPRALDELLRAAIICF